MEIAQHTFYVFDLDERASILTFFWTEKSTDMTLDDYKNAIRDYARLVLKHRARRALIDLRKFRTRVDADAGSFWGDEIVPVYNQAGLEKFALLLPEGAEVPPDDQAPVAPESGEKFVTREFSSEQAAISWLRA